MTYEWSSKRNLFVSSGAYVLYMYLCFDYWNGHFMALPHGIKHYRQ